MCDLSMEIGDIDGVGIEQAESADSSTGKVHGERAADST